MICSVANRQDITALYSLWEIAFGDGRETVDSFFENAVSIENTLTVRENDRVVSALYIIPARLKVGKKSYKAGYVYAAATLPEYRKKGYMSRLLSFASEHAEEKGFDLLFLKPDGEELYAYYEKNGYKTALYSFAPTLYDGAVPDIAMIVWDKNIELLDRSLNETESFLCDFGYAVYKTEAEKTTVEYFSSEAPCRLFDEMKSQLQIKNIYIPISNNLNGRKKEGMILPINSEINSLDNIYLGITME